MEKSPQQTPTLKLQRLALVYLAAFWLIGLALVYWSAGAGPAILQRDDNPRLVEAALRLQRGRILDVNREVLAYSGGPVNRQQRFYPIATIGPAVGYYSFRHGTAGIEEGYDAVLRGETDDPWLLWRRELLNQPQVGRDVRLTLHAQWQQKAGELLADQSGALVLLALPDRAAAGSDVAILALVSHPDYDPNQLEARFETLMADPRAPLLNRVTQGQYQPGMLLQPFILATALAQQELRLGDSPANVDDAVTLNGHQLVCAGDPLAPATWADVLYHACPAPMLPLVAALGVERLTAALTAFGLTRAPDLRIATAAPPERVVDDLLLAGIGQDVLTVTPLQLGLAWAALANEGEVPQPRLVTAVQDESGGWLAHLAKPPQGTAVRPDVARAILDSLPRHEGRIEFSALVLSGPEGATHGWYLALAPATNPRYALVVVTEGSRDIALAQQVGRALLQIVLTD
jgi:penicillin-binding protein A